MTDKEFEKLKKDIERAWKIYSMLQTLYHEQTGQDHRWLK